MTMTLGEKLKEELRKRDLTQNELARRANLVSSTVSNCVCDVQQPEELTIKKLEMALGISLREYVQEDYSKAVDEDAIIFAKSLKRLMLEREMTQIELAEMTNMSRPTITRLLKGQTLSNLRDLKKLSVALDVTLDELICGRETDEDELAGNKIGKGLVDYLRQLPEKDRKILIHLLEKN